MYREEHSQVIMDAKRNILAYSDFKLETLMSAP
jgi:hypothetical protein